MSFEIIDNTFQVIVLAAMALLAFLLAFRRSSRSCLILAFGYASFMMGTLYYLLHLIILGHGPQVFYVAECSWMASYFFFLSLEILYWEGLRPPFSPFALAAGVVIAGVVMRVQVFGPSPLMSGALALTFGALAYGLRHYRPGLPWAGVLANRVGSARHADMLQGGLNDADDWMGALMRVQPGAAPGVGKAGAARRYDFERIIGLKPDVIFIITSDPSEPELRFGIGYHPAFAIPFDDAHTPADYEFRFDELESPLCVSCLPNGLLNGTDYHYLARNTRTVPLTDDLFDNDSHCMLNLRSKTLAIVEKDTGRAVRCNIEGYPYVLIWSKPEKPYRFVCIEPWHSLPGEENGPLTWEDRPCAAALHPGETWSTTLCTTFER